MTSAFCPGHVSCIFRPVRTGDPFTTGSLGVGIRLSLGSIAAVTPRDDGEIVIRLDGKVSRSDVTRYALNLLFGGRGMDVDISHDLPMSQGFATSASGTLAACIAAQAEFGAETEEVIKAVHEAEVMTGGGLGDLPAILSGYDVPVRSVPGIPPAGRVDDSGLSLGTLSLAVLGDELETPAVLSDPVYRPMIERAGDEAMAAFRSEQTADGLFRASNMFSESSGLESEQISASIVKIRDSGYRAGMCMLGNSIFSDAPSEELKDILGDVRVYSCTSGSRAPGIIHRG